MTIINLVRSLGDKGFFHLASANFVAQFLGFALSLLITRFLPPEELGDAKILQSYIILFLVFAGSGFNAVALKYCSEERPLENREWLLKFTLFRTLITAVLAWLVMAGLAQLGLITPLPEMKTRLLIYGLAIPVIVVTDLLTTYLLASERAAQMARVQAVNKLIQFILVGAGVWGWGLDGFVAGMLISSILGLLLPLYFVGVRFLQASSQAVPAGIYSLALFSLLYYGVMILGQYGDVFILDHFIEDQIAIGHYALATYFVIAATQLTMSLGAILTPHFSRNGHNITWLRRNLVQYQLLSLAAGVVISAGMLGAAWLLIRFVYGQTYAPALGYLSVLLVRYIIFSSYAVITAAFVGVGLIKYIFLGAIISTPFGLLLSYRLQEGSGVLGLAWGQVGGSVVMLAIELCLVIYIFGRSNMIKS